MQTKLTISQSLLLALLSSSKAGNTALLNYPVHSQSAIQLMKNGEQAGGLAKFVFSRPLIEEKEVFPGDSRDWLLINAARDPLLYDRDGYPIPSRILKPLRKLAKAGLDFDAIYVAHEMTPGSVTSSTPITAELLTPPQPANVVRTSNHLGTAGSILWHIATLPVLAAMVGALGALAVGAWAIAGVGRDPILFGAKVGPCRPVVPGELASWFYLGHWAYNNGG